MQQAARLGNSLRLYNRFVGMTGDTTKVRSSLVASATQADDLRESLELGWMDLPQTLRKRAFARLIRRDFGAAFCEHAAPEPRKDLFERLMTFCANDVNCIVKEATLYLPAFSSLSLSSL